MQKFPGPLANPAPAAGKAGLRVFHINCLFYPSSKTGLTIGLIVEDWSDHRSRSVRQHPRYGCPGSDHGHGRCVSTHGRPGEAWAYPSVRSPYALVTRWSYYKLLCFNKVAGGLGKKLKDTCSLYYYGYICDL